MKTVLSIVALMIFSFTSCKVAFYTLPTVPDTASFENIQVDASYELYVKRVCKKVVNKMYEPCNCLDLPAYRIEDVVEFEYMFLSKKHEKIIVINYIKDRNQKFYTRASESFLAANKSTEAVDINIWFFNQLRFGSYDPKTNQGHFQTTDKPKEIHVWNLYQNSDTMNVRSVSLKLADGFNERISENAMALSPAFVKANSYNIIYQSPFDESNTSYPLPGNNIFVDTLRGSIYFIFDKDLSNNRRTIKFKKNRRYSYFPPNDSTQKKTKI